LRVDLFRRALLALTTGGVTPLGIETAVFL
jgi:hypothetical protein